MRKPHKLLALGLDCSHVSCKFTAPEPVSPAFLFYCAAALQQDKQQLFTEKPLQNSPQAVTGSAVNRGWGRKRTQDMQEAQILNTKGILRKLYCDKGWSVCKRGDFKRSGAEIAPYSWCWLDLTRKKVQIVVERLPAQHWTVLHCCKSCCFNWAELCFGFVFVELFQPTSSSHYLDRIKGIWQEEGEALPTEDCNNQPRMTENESHHQP